MKNLLRLLVLLGAIWLLVGCGSDKGTSTPTPTTQPDTTVTIPDVEPTPDDTTTTTRAPINPRPITFPTPPIVVPTPDPTPEPSPTTTLPSAINGQCGTVIETCAAGKYINTPDASDTARWLCQGKNGGNSVSCSQRFPAPSISVVRNFIARADKSGTSVTLGWTRPKTMVRDEIDNFLLQRAPDNSGSPGTFATVLRTKQTHYIATGLSPTTTYHFRIRAQGHVTGSEWVSLKVTTKTKPFTVQGTGPVKLMIGRLQVGAAESSRGAFEDLTLTRTIIALFCSHENKNRVRNLMPSRFDPDAYWGTGDSSFCGGKKKALLNRTSKVTFAILISDDESGDINVHHKTLDGDTDQGLHMKITFDSNGEIKLDKVMLLYDNLLRETILYEGARVRYNKNGVKQ